MVYIDFNEFQSDIHKYIQKAKKNKFFIYPTDSIYGIGAVANVENCKQLDHIKERQSGKQYSIIAPSIEWIETNFYTPDNFQDKFSEYISKYDQITMLCKRKERNFLRFLSDNRKIWLRIIKHPFQSFVKKLWQPFLTTSVNISGEPYVTSTQDIPDSIEKKVDIIIDKGRQVWQPSTIIDIETNDIIRK